MSTQQTAESGGAIAAKLAPPATVSVASIFGYPVSDLLLWLTLIYTILMILHKGYQMYKEMRG